VLFSHVNMHYRLKKSSQDEASLILERLRNFQMRPVYIGFLTLAGLLPWLVVQLEMALNTNHAWLFTAAMRLLEGGNHLHDVYEPNPPLSILLYYPSALISKYLAIAPDYSAYLVGLLSLGLSTAILWFFIKPLQGINQTEKSLLCGIYVIASCLIPSNLYFAERDEFVVWGLVPFLVAQLMVTNGYQFKGFLRFFGLFFCAILILVKPHYIVFPVILFLHRIIVSRELVGIFKTPDFWALKAACIAYVATVFLFFPSYVYEVLPAFINYYIKYPSDGVLFALTGKVLLCAIVLLALVVLPADKFYKKMSFAFVMAALLALGLYVLQMKGFAYHLVPAKIFIFLSGAALLYGVARHVVAIDGLRVCMVLIITMLMAYIAVPLKLHSQSHESYGALLLPETVKSCGSPCPFFIFAENMEMIWQTSVYSGEEHASRFPGLWWLHSMLEYGYRPEEQQKYATMVAEDLARYDPKMLIIATNLKTVQGDTFNFIEFFSNNENFRAQIDRYKLEKSITDDRGLYFKGTSGSYPFLIEYDVYMRK
jgi:hypothetical protein